MKLILPEKWHLVQFELDDAHLKLDEKSSYLTTFCCLFGRYQYIRLLFVAAPVVDMFQKKTDELFSIMLNVFGIAIGILITGFDEHDRGHDGTLEKVLHICTQSNLKLNRKINFYLGI